MANTYFAQYIDDINSIIKEARHRHDKASIALKNALERNEAAQANKDYSLERKRLEATECREAEKNYRKAIETIQSESRQALGAVRQALAKHAIEYAAADPTKVDQGAVMLLQSGVMGDADLVSLSEKFWNNPTMLKLVAAEAEKNKSNSKMALYLSSKIQTYLSPESRLRVFDDTVSIAMRSLHSDENAASLFQKLWDEQYYQAAKNGMATLDSFSAEVN